ncbi:hypothetical protein BJF79_08715 [Actinomadura sp. CNU-125]|nr:hypothetical protein BJF79_08715 [Actinomadura sp. CNU-125]
MEEDGKTGSTSRRGTRRNTRAHRTPRRDRGLCIALSEEEYACLSSAAGREFLATGAWAAEVLLAAARGSARPEYSDVRETLIEVMRASGQARRIGVNLNQVVAALHAGDPPPQLRWYAEAAARAVQRLDDLAEELRRRLP